MKIFKAEYKGYLDGGESEEVDFNGYLNGTDWIVYNYKTGCYEGSGVSIHKKQGKYYQSNLGHCSCYGPTDGIEETKGYETIQDLIKDCSEELGEQLQPLLDVIKKENLCG